MVEFYDCIKGVYILKGRFPALMDVPDDTLPVDRFLDNVEGVALQVETQWSICDETPYETAPESEMSIIPIVLSQKSFRIFH